MTTETSIFSDRHGRSWTLTLDPVLLNVVKNECGIRLTDLKADPFERLSSDPVLLIEVLWLLCEAEAQARSLTYMEFAKSIHGEQLDGIVAALEVAVLNFCPSSRRSSWKSLIEENSRIRRQATEKTIQEIQANRTEIVDTMSKNAMQHLRKSLESSDSSRSDDATSAT